MIETRVIKELRVTLHSVLEYNHTKRYYPDLSEELLFESSEEEYDVDDISDVFVSDGNVTTIRVINDDHQGGSHTVQVLDDAEEIREIIRNKKKYLNQ